MRNECIPMDPPKDAIVRGGFSVSPQDLRLSIVGPLGSKERAERACRSHLALILTDPNNAKGKASIRQETSISPATGHHHMELTTVIMHPDELRALGRRIRDWEEWYNLLPYTDRLRFPEPPGGRQE